jgi:tellurite resistance protein TerC
MDNLLVFVILISWSQVPARLHGRVVLAGIGLAVVLRGVVIGIGAAALHRFGWLEYLFGLFLLYTAVQIARHPNEAPPPTGTSAGHVRGEFARSGGPPENAAGVPVPMTENPPGAAGRIAARLTRRGTAGVLGLVAALGVVLAFIGVKLFADALHGSGVTSLGPVPVPQIGPWLSLAIIALVLGTTAVASVVVTRRQARERERPTARSATASADPGQPPANDRADLAHPPWRAKSEG